MRKRYKRWGQTYLSPARHVSAVTIPRRPRSLSKPTARPPESPFPPTGEHSSARPHGGRPPKPRPSQPAGGTAACAWTAAPLREGRRRLPRRDPCGHGGPLPTETAARRGQPRPWRDQRGGRGNPRHHPPARGGGARARGRGRGPPLPTPPPSAAVVVVVSRALPARPCRRLGGPAPLRQAGPASRVRGV